MVAAAYRRNAAQFAYANFWLTLRKAVNSENIPKRVDNSHVTQRRWLPKHTASRARFSASDHSSFKRAASAGRRSTTSTARSPDDGRSSSRIEPLKPARLRASSRRKIWNVRNKEKSSKRVVTAECSQFSGEHSTVLMAASGNGKHMLERWELKL